MSHVKAKMHQILFPASPFVRPSVHQSLRWSLTLIIVNQADHSVAPKRI